jgi:hypothetical protein
MLLLRNPFTNRERIKTEDEFFGRETELRAVYTRLLGGASVSLVGERRTGKSSLLNALNFAGERESLGIPAQLRFAYTDFQDIAGCGEDIYLEYLCDNFAAAMDLSPPPKPSRARLKELALQARSKGLMPVLAIDEFDLLLENDKVGLEFLAFLRSWSSGTQVPMVLASWEGSIEELTENPRTGSNFLNIFAPVYVGPLELADALELVTVPAESMGEPFLSEEVEWIRAYGGLHPFFLQMACFHMFEARRKCNGSGEEATKVAEANFAYDATPHMRLLLGRLQHRERAALEYSLGLNSNAVADNWYEGLLRRGILIRDPQQRIFSKTFAKIVADEQSIP